MHLSPPVAWAAGRSKAVILLLSIYCLMYSPLFVGVLCLSLFCYALLCDHSSFAIILKRKRKLVRFLSLSYRCIVTTKIYVLWLFLMVPWFGLQCVIVEFPDHTHFFLSVYLHLAAKIHIRVSRSSIMICQSLTVQFGT